MVTIFERKNTLKEQISFEDLANEQSRILPKREEMSVINYHMGYPYGGGYDGYFASSHDNYYSRIDCYGRSYEYQPVKFDYHKDWDDDDKWEDWNDRNDRDEWDDDEWEELMRDSQMGYYPASFDPYLSSGYGYGYGGSYNPYVWYGNEGDFGYNGYGYNGSYGSYPGYVI